MLDNIKAVIFDLDGTVVDSMWMWEAIDIEYLARFGIPLPADLQKKISGMSFSETAVYFKETFGIPDSLDKIKADWNDMAMYKYCHEVPLKPGVLSFLQELKKRGIKTGIATSNSVELLNYFLKAHELHNYFEVVITGSDGLRGKPAPDMYLEAAKRLSVKPEKCLVFEDIMPGILAGKRAGMRVCAVDDVYSNDITDKKIEEADYFIKSFEDIL